MSRIDLGTLPPRVSIPLHLRLSPLQASARLEDLFPTCGCMQTSVVVNGKRVQPGALIPAGGLLEVAILYEPVGKKGKVGEQVLATFVTEARKTVRRRVRISCRLDPAASLLSKTEVREHLLLPNSTVIKKLRLKSPPGAESVRVDEAAWLEASVLNEDSGEHILSLMIRPIEATGSYSAVVRLPLPAGGHELLPVHVRAYAAEHLVPGRISLTLRPHQARRVRLRLLGSKVDFEPGCVEWVQDPLFSSGSDQHGQPEALRLAIKRAPATQPGGPGEGSGTQLVFSAEAGESLAIFKGKALIRPFPAARHRLTLPYVVRISSSAGTLTTTQAPKQEGWTK